MSFPQMILVSSTVELLRKQAHQTGKPNARHYARLLNVSPQTICRAIRGITYKHLNKIYPPFTNKSSSFRKILKDQDVISLRQRLHGQEKIDIKRCAYDHGVSVSTLQQAIRGVTYKRLNKDHPPFITKDRIRKVNQHG